MRFFSAKDNFSEFFFSLSIYDFVVCRLRQNSSKYPTLPGFLMSSVYVDLAFQHTLPVFLSLLMSSCTALLYMLSCKCVRVCTCSSCWQFQIGFSELSTLQLLRLRPLYILLLELHFVVCRILHCIILYRVFVVLFGVLVGALQMRMKKHSGRWKRYRFVHVSFYVKFKHTYFMGGKYANSL